MKRAQAAIRQLLLSTGYDMPGEPTLPPLDVAEQSTAAIGLALAEFAHACGLEAGLHLCRSTVPAPRGLEAIRQSLRQLHLALALAGVELGIDDFAHPPTPEQIERFAALVRRVRQLKPLDPAS